MCMEMVQSKVGWKNDTHNSVFHNTNCGHWIQGLQRLWAACLSWFDKNKKGTTKRSFFFLLAPKLF